MILIFIRKIMYLLMIGVVCFYLFEWSSDVFLWVAFCLANVVLLRIYLI